MTSHGGGFFEQFIEDYFAECDEHLATARRALLGLESELPHGAPPSPQHLRELFRSLHTLKGLSGMVGDERAERVAHALEDALRTVERAGAPLATASLDPFFRGVELLERCVASRRAGSAPPSIDDALGELGNVASAGSPSVVRTEASVPPAPLPPAAGPSSASDSEVSADHDAGEVVYHFEFTPSMALTQRGVGVDAIRARLRTLGALLDAKPRIAGGGVIFDFWVGVDAGRAPDEAWSADGLRWTAALPDAAATPEPSLAKIETSRSHVDDRAAIPTTAPGATSSSSLVRVDLERVDAVMRLVGDLVVSRSRLDDVLRQAASTERGALLDAVEEINAAMERQLRRLRESVMRVRLVPVGEVFERLRFAARDAIRESGKQVSLVLRGQETEVDKLVVDRMMEPLLHLVRNAVSHGIESPTERAAHGKPAEGTLTLSATAAGDRIVVQVEDDGAGIDLERVERQARDRGLLAPDEPLTTDRLLDVLCAPGFSTRDAADLTSGRGMGMEVVRATVRALSGELSVETTPGRGTRFAIELPLTLMILDALLVDVAGQQMAIPQPALLEILQVDAATMVSFENNDVVPYRGGVLPLVSLARLFRFGESQSASLYVLVVGSASAPMGLVVDRLLGLREIVVHPVTDPLVAMPGIGGATELGDGRVSLILDAPALIHLARAQRETRRWRGRSSDSPRAAFAGTGRAPLTLRGS